MCHLGQQGSCVPLTCLELKRSKPSDLQTSKAPLVPSQGGLPSVSEKGDTSLTPAVPLPICEREAGSDPQAQDGGRVVIELSDLSRPLIRLPALSLGVHRCQLSEHRLLLAEGGEGCPPELAN